MLFYIETKDTIGLMKPVLNTLNDRPNNANDPNCEEQLLGGIDQLF